MSTPPSRSRSGWRNRLGRGLTRFLGLLAHVGRLRHALCRALFGSRERSTLTVVVAGGLCAALGAVLLLVPGSRGVIGGVTRVPAAVIHTIVPSNVTDSSADKAYPRLYSLKLGVDVAIRPGDGRTPPVLPIAFQYPDTAPIGKPGNTYLYAHDRPGMFLGLHRARVGDVLVLATSATDKLYFQVTEIHKDVAWNDLEWLRPTTDVRLTLQTCNLSGDYDPRYIVVTRLIPAGLGAALTGHA